MTRDGQLTSYNSLDAVVLLPTLNEEEGLPLTLAEIPFSEMRALGWSVRPLIIDGGSTDRTREVAASHGIPVIAQRSRGKGAAIREAIELLDQLNVRHLVVLDADATYPGSAVLPALGLLNSGSDLVVGVRQPDTGHPRSFRDLVHRVGNILLNFAAGQYSRSRYLDLTTGFWALDVRKALELELRTDGFGIEAELFLKAHQFGWNTSQIPVEYHKRAGVAKLHAVPDGTRILLTILRFGRRSLLRAPPTISETPGILRRLLVTTFIQHPRHVELRCVPELQTEAKALSQHLERTGISSQVVVAEPWEASAAPSGVPTPPEPVRDLRDVDGGISIRFGPGGHVLHVELINARPPASTETDSGSSSAESRSGAYASKEPAGRSGFLDPLRLLGHQLSGDPASVRNRLLSANGIVLDEIPKIEPEDDDVAPRTETVSQDA